MVKEAHAEHRKSSGSLLEKLIDMAEERRFTLLTAFIYLMAIGIVRSFSESYTGIYATFGIHLLTQHTIFYFAAFFPGAIAISILGNIDMKKVINVQLFGFWINVLPAFFDLLIYGRSFEVGARYDFISPAKVLTPRYWIDPVYAIEGTPIAFKTMLLLLPTLPAIYVAVKWYLRTKDSGISTRISYIVTRSIATFYGVWFVLAWIGGLMLFMRIDSANSEIVLFNTIRQPILLRYYTGIGPLGDAFFMANEAQFLVIQQRAMTMALEYLTFLLIFLIPAMHIWKKGSVRALVRTLDPFFLIYSALAYMLGIIIAGVVFPEYVFHWPYIAFGYVVFICTWEAVRLSSRTKKEKKSRKKRKKEATEEKPYLSYYLTETDYKQLPLVLLILATFLAMNLGPLSFLILGITLGLGLLHHRLKDEKQKLYIASSVGLLAFLNGIFTPSMWYIKEWNQSLPETSEIINSIKTVVYYRSIEFSPTAIVMAISLLFLGAGISLLKRDLLELRTSEKTGESEQGTASVFLYIGMLLPILLLTGDLLMISLLIIMFLLAYLLPMLKERAGEKEGEKYRAKYILPIVMLELLLLILKYSGML